MKITVLGSCSGTEPAPGRHHTSMVLETGEDVTFFDAGENCGYSSYLLGIDQLKTKNIFISHTHMDHIGGLPHLLWNFRKLCTLSKENLNRMKGREIGIYMPNLPVLEGIRAMLQGSEGNYETVFTLAGHETADGLVYQQGDFSVEALHTYHLGEVPAGEPWKAFSYRIQAEGKKIFYSGDFRDLDELLPLLQGCDLVMLETGHHRAWKLCQELQEKQIDFGRVLFYHHGVEILADFPGELALARNVLGNRVDFAVDGMQLLL